MNIDKLNTQAINNSLESGTINIPVTVNSNPVTNKEAATLDYLNQQANQHLLKANPVMTGSLQLTYTPTDDNHIVSKQYVLDANAQRVNSSQAYFSNHIQNYLPKNGGTITGDLILSGNPVNNFDLATYGYLQSKIANMTGGGSITDGVKTGTIVEVPYNYTYNNSAYLLCNGASVSKTTYSNLYGVIGDNFTTLYPSTDKPWQSQYGINPSTQNDITGWTSTNSLMTAAYYAASLVTKNYIYVLGGQSSNGAALNTIQRASFDNNGVLSSAWSNVGTLPVAMYGMGYAATKGRFYLIGGYDDTDHSTSSVYSAPINPDGTLGSFREEISLPDTRGYNSCFVIKNKLYVVCGNTNTNDIYQTTINNDGTLNSWIILTNTPTFTSNIKSLVIKDRIYIFSSAIYYNTYNSNGDITGTWRNIQDIPNNTTSSMIVCTDNYVFSIGGYIGGNNQYTNASYRAPILADGSIGSWAQISNGPVAAIAAQSAIAGNKIYFIGGYYEDSNNNHFYLNTVYSAAFTSGITDYTQYYTDQSNTSSTFNLPDLTSRSNTSPRMKYIIKT
jgi:hypothetical protein